MDFDILEKIKKLQEIRGWSNYRLAKEAEISEGSLNNLFRLGNLPTIPTLTAICNGFGITLSQFFAEDGESVPLNDEQREMLDIWNALEKKQRAAIFILAKNLAGDLP